MGTILENNIKLDKEISKLASTLHNRINSIRNLTKFTTFKTRLKFLNAFVIGKLNYMLPIYSLCNTINKNKLHKIITTSARCAIGNYCFKKSLKYIFDKFKWMDLETMIHFSSINIIHKLIKNKQPSSILNILKINKNTRTTTQITTHYIPKTEHFKKFYIYKQLKLYNNIENDTKNKSIIGFKNEMRQRLLYKPVSDTCD